MSLLTRSTELKRFRQGRLPKIALAVLLVIPLIYGALYLWAFWAPTDHMNRLPVAIVNLDQPAEKPDGSALTAGDDVVTQLQEGEDLDWKPLDASAAAAAVAHGDVYFSVTIPRDFSRTLAGLQDDPKAGEIEVVYNDNNSFLASTLGKQAMVQLRDAVAESATQTAADQVLVGVEKLSDGTRDAAEAAGTLDTGATTLSEASSRLSDGVGQLSEGASALSDGVGKVSDGSQKLSVGLGRLADGSAELARKAPELATGSAKLSKGIAKLDAGAAQLSTGAASAATGSAKLADGIGAMAAGSPSLAQGTGLIAQLAQSNPDLTLAQLDAMLQSKGASLAALSAGAAQLDAGLQTANQGAQQLRSGTAELSSGAKALHRGTGDAASGAGDLAAGAKKANAGVQKLNAGLQSAAPKAGELAAGAGQAHAGAAKLSAGAGEAATGSSQLADGAQKLTSGTGEFADKLADGAAEAPEFAPGQTEKIAETMAAPVQLSEKTENQVQGFGEGFAPFFIALASFVGALITWLILRPLPRRPLGSRVSGLRSVLTGLLPAALIGVGQVAIMMAVLVFGIGTRPAHWVGMSLFMLLVTLAFLALQQMFIAVLGTAAGRVVSLVLLMLMLSSSGGTYPVETTPGFFQALHPFMPASYVVEGLRQLIGGGIDARFWGSLAVMAGVLIGSLAISAIAARRQKVWTVKRLHPELAI